MENLNRHVITGAGKFSFEPTTLIKGGRHLTEKIFTVTGLPWKHILKLDIHGG